VKRLGALIATALALGFGAGRVASSVSVESPDPGWSVACNGTPQICVPDYLYTPTPEVPLPTATPTRTPTASPTASRTPQPTPTKYTPLAPTNTPTATTTHAATPTSQPLSITCDVYPCDVRPSDLGLEPGISFRYQTRGTLYVREGSGIAYAKTGEITANGAIYDVWLIRIKTAGSAGERWACKEAANICHQWFAIQGDFQNPIGELEIYSIDVTQY
jgi:hypothetical protein